MLSADRAETDQRGGYYPRILGFAPPEPPGNQREAACAQADPTLSLAFVQASYYDPPRLNLPRGILFHVWC